MTNKVTSMPGGMSESPTTGEPASNPSRTKHSLNRVPAVTESMTDPVLGNERSAEEQSESKARSLRRRNPKSRKDVRKPPESLARTPSNESKGGATGMTRTQSGGVGKGLDRSGEDGDRPTKDLDRSGRNPDGDRSSKNQSRPGEAGNDRLGGNGNEGEDKPDPGGRPPETTPPGEKPTVVSTPLESPSDESELRIESDLLENNKSPEDSSLSKKPKVSGSGGRAGAVNANPMNFPEGINLDEPFPVVTNPVTPGITPREFLVRKTPSPAPVQQEWTEKCEQIVNVDR